MPAMNMIQALNSALDVMLTKDPNVLTFGEDVGFFGGVFRVTDGLQKKHGLTRCFDSHALQHRLGDRFRGKRRDLLAVRSQELQTVHGQNHLPFAVVEDRKANGDDI